MGSFKILGREVAAFLIAVSLLVTACAPAIPAALPSPSPEPPTSTVSVPPPAAPQAATPTPPSDSTSVSTPAPATETSTPAPATETSLPAATPSPRPPGAPPLVTVTATDGTTLVAAFYAPPDASGEGAPAVLLLHMLGRKKETWDEFARKLQANGFGVMALDLRGHGESGGEVDWTKAPDDVHAAWVALTQQPGVDKSRTAVIGASIGANLALILGAAEPDVKGVVLLSPGLNYRGVGTEGAVKSYGPRPILLVASEDDKYSADTIKRLNTLAQGDSHEMILFADVGHGMEMLALEKDLEDSLVNWLKQNVQ